MKQTCGKSGGRVFTKSGGNCTFLMLAMGFQESIIFATHTRFLPFWIVAEWCGKNEISSTKPERKLRLQ